MATSIRLATPADAAVLSEIYRPYVTDSAISFEESPPSNAEMAGRVAKTLARFPWLVAEAGGPVIGYAYAGEHRLRAAYRWSVEVSVYVAITAQRTGVGRALYTKLFALLRLQKYVNAYAGITLPNPASVGFHEALGFEPVGVYQGIGFKFGRWHDVGWWQLAIGERSTAPAEPIPIGDVSRPLDSARPARA